jgi:hypothetical protein
MYGNRMIFHRRWAAIRHSAFVAEFPEPPGCMADGKTYQETLSNAEKIIGDNRDDVDKLYKLKHPSHIVCLNKVCIICQQRPLNYSLRSRPAGYAFVSLRYV